MPKAISELISDALSANKLDILVFGPQVAKPSPDPRMAKYQAKRKEIRAKLEELGHNVGYAEDLVDLKIPGPSGNAYFQELLLMEAYDFIVNIVESPGSIAEGTVPANKREIAQKTSIFIDQSHEHGFVFATFEVAKIMGAHLHGINYPNDLDHCHLLGAIEERVTQIQIMKYLL